MITLREQLETELAAAEYAAEFASKVESAHFLSRTGSYPSFEIALLSLGVDQLTADQLVTGHMRRPSLSRAYGVVTRLKARIAGLDRFNAAKESQ